MFNSSNTLVYSEVHSFDSILINCLGLYTLMIRNLYLLFRYTGLLGQKFRKTFLHMAEALFPIEC